MSNFYANRVNSEHPIAVWPLDDDHQFVSLITEDYRNISDSPSGANLGLSLYGTKDTVPWTHNPADIPFENSVVTQIGPSNPANAFYLWETAIAESSAYGIKSLPTATYTWAANVITVTATEHGFPVGQKVFLDFTSGSAADDVFVITSVTANSFTVAKTGSGTGGNVTVKYTSVPISGSVYVWMDSYSIDYIDFGSVTSYTRNVIPSTAAQTWVKLTAEEILPFTGESLYLYMHPRAGQSIEATTIYFNGFSIGQYSEQSNADSLGTELITTPSALKTDNPSGTDTLPTSSSVKVARGTSFSMKELEIYSVAENNRLLAYNAGIPMAYGSKYSMRLRPAAVEGEYPSLVLDGGGFYTDSGRYDTFTMEFWLRLNGSSGTSRKIFGPTMTSDGLYVNNGIFTIVFGTHTASANIAVTDAPHLIHIRYGGGKADLLVDGEKLASVEVDVKSLNLATVNSTINQKWLGFWSYSDIGPVDLDCISLFPYLVTEPVAKRRFVWGQGVTDVGIVNSQFNGETVYTDGSTADYAHNVSYPDTFFWDSGKHNNVKITTDRIFVADRPLPEFRLSQHSLSEWYQDLEPIQSGDGFFTFRPNSDPDWLAENSYIRFGSFDNFCTNAKALSIRWSTPDTSETYAESESSYVGLTYDEFTSLVLASFATYADLDGDVGSNTPVMLIRSKSSPSKMVYLYTDSVKVYASWIDGAAVTSLFQQTISVDTEYLTVINLAGLNAPSTSTTIPDSMFMFLQNKADLEILVAGDGSRTFAGKVFNVSFIDDYYLPQLDGLYNEDDFVSSAAYSSTYEPFDLCSYTLLPMNKHGNFYADVGVRGYWEDYIPLQMLSGITDPSTDEFVSIDTIQMNIGAPVASPTSSQGSSSSWTYSDMASDFGSMILSDLYHGTSTGYQTYDDLQTQNAVAPSYESIDTSNMFVRSYLSFQSSPKRLKNINDLSGYYPPSTSGTVYTGALTDPYDSKIEFVDGTVVIPPKKKNLKTAVMGVYLEFAVKGINTYPVSVKSLEASSTVNREGSFVPVGTKYGPKLYPFVANNYGYDFAATNPVRINKRGFPLFYRSRDSGFTPLAIQTNESNKGCFAYFGRTNEPITVDSAQLWVRRENLFSDVEENVFEFNYTNSLYGIKDQKKIWFGLKAFPYDKTRGVLTAYDENNALVGDISFVHNGNVVGRPVIELKEWSAIGVVFNSTAKRELSSALMIKMHTGLTLENVSVFRPTELAGVVVNYRLWSEVDDQNWDYWVASDWGTVLAPALGAVKSINVAKLVYDSYVGERVYQVTSGSPLRVERGKARISSETSWSSQVLIPS